MVTATKKNIVVGNTPYGDMIFGTIIPLVLITGPLRLRCTTRKFNLATTTFFTPLHADQHTYIKQSYSLWTHSISHMFPNLCIFCDLTPIKIHGLKSSLCKMCVDNDPNQTRRICICLLQCIRIGETYGKVSIEISVRVYSCAQAHACLRAMNLGLQVGVSKHAYACTHVCGLCARHCALVCEFSHCMCRLGE